MKKILEIISSIKGAIVLLFIFAFSIGIATFIENDFGTETALAEVYRAKWFEVLLLILSLNLLLVFFKFNMHKFKKWYVSLFHISFIIVIIGAYLTRYIGYEGTMHIREGQSSDYILSEKSFIDITIDEKLINSSPMIFSNISINSFKTDLENFEVTLKEYIPYSSYQFVKSENGTSQVSMIVSIQDGLKPVSIDLEEGNFYDFGFTVVDFNANYTSKTKHNQRILKIKRDGQVLQLLSDNNISSFSMDTQKESFFEHSTIIKKRLLFRADNLSIVFKSIDIGVEKKLVSNMSLPKNDREKLKSALILSIKTENSEKELIVFGQSGVIGVPSSVNIDDKKVSISYGSKIVSLPFSIYLKDFQLERYAGSMSPSSYASEVTLNDIEDNMSMDYRIYMNNILAYKGYRFFQSSYDKDEGGTILSVNFDPGTPITYIGYFMMFLGLIFTLFGEKSRFQKLRKDLAKFSAIAFLIFSFNTTSLKAERIEIESIQTIFQFDKAHANKFGELLVQDSSGRTKPLDSLNMEVLNKIHRNNKIEGMNHNQIILGMLLKPNLWKQIKMIYTKDVKVNEIIGVAKNEKYISFNDFFENASMLEGYKLASFVSEALRVAPKKRGKFEKAILKIDERVNISYMIYSGNLLRIYPKPSDSNNLWVSTVDALQTFNKKESELVKNITIEYFQQIDFSLRNGNWSNTDKALLNIVNFQKNYGNSIYIDENRIQAEIIYNKLHIFQKLIPYTFGIGFILLIIAFVQLLKENAKFKRTLFVFKSAISVIFLLYTAGLILRWYISGHAPWSDAYESLIYIGWATLLAGFLFSKSSPFILASTTILSGIILFVANLSWLDPQITNLVPVLKSYWLTIHVSMITASYGFLALGSFLGFIVLLLFIFKTENNQERFQKSIIELNIINEMNLLIGLVLLTIGNFLGGVWANESWGRYWGWDSKETWALVTILVYVIVLHIRLVPKIYSQYSFALLSLISFSSVLMTYFGVNFYLSGMHSYAQGDPIPIPVFVYYMIFTIFIMAILAYRKRKFK